MKKANQIMTQFKLTVVICEVLKQWIMCVTIAQLGAKSIHPVIWDK